MKKTGEIKSLSGGDLQEYEFKGKNGTLKDKNYAKLIISSNGLPESDDKSIGYLRRWVIIEFNNYFEVGKNPVETIPNIEYENFAKKSLRILKELKQKYHFTNEETLQEKMQHYERLSDPIKKFINENYKDDPDGQIPIFKFKEHLEEYLTKHGQRKVSDKELTMKMKELGYESKLIGVKVGEKHTTWRHYIGLRDKQGLERFETPEVKPKEEALEDFILIDGEFPEKLCAKCNKKKECVAKRNDLLYCEECYTFITSQKTLGVE